MTYHSAVIGVRLVSALQGSLAMKSHPPFVPCLGVGNCSHLPALVSDTEVLCTIPFPSEGTRSPGTPSSGIETLLRCPQGSQMSEGKAYWEGPVSQWKI